MFVTKITSLPTNTKTKSLVTNNKLSKLLKYYSILWGLYILFFILLGFAKSHWPELLENEYEQKFLQEMLKKNPLKIFVLGVIFAPIIEEMMFRTLIKPSHDDLILFICSWPIFFINKFLPVDVYWIIKLSFTAILIFTLFYILRHLITEQQTAHLRKILTKYYMPVLIVSSLIFGIVHINNYVEDFIINATLISLIIPRIISGTMMGLIKIKNKHIGWSMGLHALNNGVVLVILILSQNFSP